MMGSVLHLVIDDPSVDEDDDSNCTSTRRPLTGAPTDMISMLTTTKRPFQDITINGLIYYDDSSRDSLDAYRDMSFGMAWVMLVMCSIGVLTNTMSIFVYTHKSMRRTPINILLTGLSIIDLCLSLLSIPAFIVPGFFTYYRTWTLELIMCYSAVFVYPLTSTTHTASVWTFVIIALERWHAVKRGGRDLVSGGRQRSILRRKRRRTCVGALATVCLLSLIYNVVRFFEFELITNDESKPDPDHTRSDSEGVAPYTVPMVVPLLRNSTLHPSYMQVYYVGLYLVTHFAIPFICLVIVNGLTLHVVYRAKQRRKKLLTRRERKEHQTTQMMVTVVLMFIFCYTLVFTLNIIEAVDDAWFHTDENRLMAYALNDISNMLVITNAASTAMIYYIFNRRYRELCLGLVSKLCARVSLCCCFCTSCWCRRSCLEFLERHQRVLDRRRSTVHSTATECNEERIMDIARREQIEGAHMSRKRSFLIVPTVDLYQARRFSSSSSLDNKEGLMAL